MSGGKKRIPLIGGGLAAILFLVVLMSVWFYGASGTGAETPHDKQTTVTFVYAHQNHQWDEAVSSSVARFEEQNPQVDIVCKIQYQNKVYDEALNKLYARNELGDIVQLKTPAAFAECGALAEIPERVSALVPSQYVWDGAVYGVNALATTTGIVYDRALFEALSLEEPKTYEEFLSLCKTIQEHGKTPMLFAGADLWHLEFLLNHFFQTNVISKDENWEVSDGTDDVWIQDPDIRSVFLDIKKPFTLNAVNRDWSVTEDGSTAYLMTRKKAAMLYTGCWTAREILEIDPTMQLGWFYLPDDEGRVIVTDTRDAFFCLTRECGDDAAKYEAASAFLEFFYSEENYQEVLRMLYGISATTERTDTGGDPLWEAILAGYEANPRVTKYIGDEGTPQGFERELLQQTLAYFSNEETLDEELLSLNELWKAGMTP